MVIVEHTTNPSNFFVQEKDPQAQSSTSGLLKGTTKCNSIPIDFLPASLPGLQAAYHPINYFLCALSSLVVFCIGEHTTNPSDFLFHPRGDLLARCSQHLVSFKILPGNLHVFSSLHFLSIRPTLSQSYPLFCFMCLFLSSEWAENEPKCILYKPIFGRRHFLNILLPTLLGFGWESVSWVSIRD